MGYAVRLRATGENWNMTCNAMNPWGTDYQAGAHVSGRRVRAAIGIVICLFMALVCVMLCAAWRYSDLSLKGATCIYCHRKATFLDRLERVHIEPQSVNPARINDPANIVIMHRSCHAVLQHRWNFHEYNPDMMFFITAYTNWQECRKGE